MCGFYFDKAWGVHNDKTRSYLYRDRSDCALGCARIGAVTNTARILLNVQFTVKLEMDFVIIAAHHVVDGFHTVDHDLPSEHHSQPLNHAKEAALGGSAPA